MARSAAPITISSQAPTISWDEITDCMAEASAILWAVKMRREARLADLAQAQALIEAVQEERTPKPKGEAL
jgi:hypothetical protein